MSQHSLMSILMHEKFFDVLILILFACACLRWLAAGNYGRATYWGSAFVLNVSVTFMIGVSK